MKKKTENEPIDKRSPQDPPLFRTDSFLGSRGWRPNKHSPLDHEDALPKDEPKLPELKK